VAHNGGAPRERWAVIPGDSAEEACEAAEATAVTRASRGFRVALGIPSAAWCRKSGPAGLTNPE